VLSSHHALGNLAFSASLYVTCGIFSNIATDACKYARDSIQSSLTCHFLKTLAIIRIHYKVYTHKLQTMLDTSVVSFYDNFGLFFKGSEDMVTKGIENWPLSTTRLLILTPSRVRTPANIPISLISPKTSLWRTFLLLTVWEYLRAFSHSSVRKRGKKYSQTEDENRF